MDGMGSREGHQSPSATIFYPSYANRMEYNKVHDVAYTGLRMIAPGTTSSADSSIIRRNNIYKAMSNYGDGGLIYVDRSTGHATVVDALKIYENILDNSTSAHRTNVVGVYLDDGAYHTTIDRNVIIGVGNGTTSKSFESVYLRDNIIYDCDRASDINSNSGKFTEPYFEDFKYIGNKVITKKPIQIGKYIAMGSGLKSSFGGELDVQNMGVVDSNVYVNPIRTDDGVDSVALWTTSPSTAQYGSKYTPIFFGSRFGHEQHAIVRKYKPQYNVTSNGTLAYVARTYSTNAEVTGGFVNGYSGGNASITWDASSPLDAGAVKIEFTSPNDTSYSWNSYVTFRVTPVGEDAMPPDSLYIIKASIYASEAAELAMTLAGATGIDVMRSHELHFNLSAGRNDLTIPVKTYSDKYFEGVGFRFLNQTATYHVDNLEVYRTPTYTENLPSSHFLNPIPNPKEPHRTHP